MTKKDYVLMAGVLHMASYYMTFAQTSEVVEHTCRLLKQDNPQFDRAKFVKEVALPLANMRKVLKDQ